MLPYSMHGTSLVSIKQALIRVRVLVLITLSRSSTNSSSSSRNRNSSSASARNRNSASTNKRASYSGLRLFCNFQRSLLLKHFSASLSGVAFDLEKRKAILLSS